MFLSLSKPPTYVTQKQVSLAISSSPCLNLCSTESVCDIVTGWCFSLCILTVFFFVLLISFRAFINGGLCLFGLTFFIIGCSGLPFLILLLFSSAALLLALLLWPLSLFSLLFLLSLCGLCWLDVCDCGDRGSQSDRWNPS